MKVKSQGFFLLRRPLLPIEILQNFHQLVKNEAGLFEQELVHFFSKPDMIEALYVASPELYQAFVTFLAGHQKESPEKLLKTLYKYLLRMTTRSTPYGLFAGATVGEIHSSTHIQFDEEQPYRTHSRLDMNYVAEMAANLLKRPHIRRKIKFHPNTSLYRIGRAYRYVEGVVKNKRRNYILASVEWSPYLESMLALAQNGCTIQVLAEQLVSDEITWEEAVQFIHDSIDAQLLVSELEATATGDEFFKVLLTKLQLIPGTEEEVRQLLEIESLLQLQHAGIEKYQHIQSIINQHFAITGSKDLIQTDLFFNTTRCVLSHHFVSVVAEELQKVVALARPNPKIDLDNFKRQFYERYEEQEVPLLTAIDNETGIGYGSLTAGKADNLPLLDYLWLPGSNRPESTEWSSLTKLKYQIYQQAVSKGEAVIQLTDKMMEGCNEGNAPQTITHDSFYVFGSLFSSSEAAIDQGNFKFSTQAISGSSGLKLLGRFCHGNEQLTEWVRKALEEEETYHPDAIFAEITHLPEARVGNVIMRPFLREYEIPYLAGSSLPKEYQIMPDDLMVSVPGGKEIVLRSKRLNRRVFPRLTNAHNYFTGLPFYRFLCELPFQGVNYDYVWNWGFLNGHPFLPRVEYKHLIISKAIWNIKRDDYERLRDQNTTGIQELRDLRTQLNLPRLVQVLEGESELLIDFEFDFSVQLLWDILRKNHKVRLTEFLGEPENCFLRNSEGRYTNEIIIPLLKERQVIEAPRTWERVKNPTDVQRTFMVGSEWLYVKIYTGTKMADHLLTTFIKPFTEELLARRIIEKWFFIRYGDPDDHIRLRFFHSQHPLFWQTILQELNIRLQPWLTQGLIHRIQTDTYKREIERYGAPTIEQIESVFYADSVSVVNFLDLLGGDEGERYRWLMAIRGVDMLLEDIGYDLHQKKQLIAILQHNFFQEFKGNNQLNYQLNDKYRANAKEIASFLNPDHDSLNEIEEAVQVFKERSIHIKVLIPQLFPDLEGPLDSLSSSLVHMFLNRLFISKQRVHEMVIYHYLNKFYESTLARMEKAGKQKHFGKIKGE